LNEKQYLILCKLADKVLLENNAKPTRICIPWLHIIREHPVFLKNYEGLFLADTGNFMLIKMWKKSVRNYLSLLKILLKSFFNSEISQWSKTLDSLSTRDIIFVSHLLNKTQFEKRTDSYYGDLPHKLNADGFPSLIAMLNHTKEKSSQNITKHNKEKICRVVFPQNLGFLKELKNLRMLFEESNILKNSAKSERHELKKKFYVRHQLKPCLQGV